MVAECDGRPDLLSAADLLTDLIEVAKLVQSPIVQRTKHVDVSPSSHLVGDAAERFLPAKHGQNVKNAG